MNELEIIKQTLPVLEIKDYDLIKKVCEQDVEKYQNYVVTENSLADDIKLRAELNNKAKAINSKRLEIEKVISEPIKNFKSKCDDLIALYNNASTLIDNQIKVFETRSKEEKKSEITKIFNGFVEKEPISGIINLDMIFDEKWLNKTVKLSDIENEIFEKIRKIAKDLDAIKNLKSDNELALTSQYLKTFDLGQVIIENNKLNELKVSTQKVEVAKEEVKQEKMQEMTTNPVEVETDDPVQTYRLEITGKLSQLKKLKEFLKLNNMSVVNLDELKKRGEE